MRIHQLLNEACRVHDALVNDGGICEQIGAWVDAMVGALRQGNRIILCGNGGSFSDAQHITAEFVGRFQMERRSLPAICLGTNSSTATAIGNDYGFEHIFSRELSAIGNSGDVLIALSTSGNSANILAAIDTAVSLGMIVFGLTGSKKGAMASRCSCIEVPSESTPRIQECHILIGHILCDCIEHRLFSR